MQQDTELGEWQRQWQAHDDVRTGLHQKVEHQIRMARLRRAASVVVTVVFGLGVPARALLLQRTADAVIAVGVWVFIVITWTVSWSLHRGTEKPVATTTLAFLDFSIHLCRRQRDAIAAASVLYIAFLAFVVASQYHGARSERAMAVWPFLVSLHNLIVWGVTVLLGAAALWRRRRLDAELKNLRTLREQVEHAES